MSRQAVAWKATEHIEIGQLSYQRACAKLYKLYTLTEGPEAQRLHTACRDKEGAPNNMALKYGRGTGVLGDYIATPDEMMKRENLKTLHTVLNLALEKSKDAGHFHPQVTREYDTHHQRSLELALEAHHASNQGLNSGSNKAFEIAFYWSALADHYLHDAFAVGHMGYNRAGSTLNAARLYHNAGNVWGRQIRNGCGDTWFALGDGGLACMREPTAKNCEVSDRASPEKWPELNAGYAQILEAATLSVFEVLHVFIFGRTFAPNFRRTATVKQLCAEDWKKPAYLLLPQQASIGTSRVSLFGDLEPLDWDDTHLVELSELPKVVRVRTQAWGNVSVLEEDRTLTASLDVFPALTSTDVPWPVGLELRAGSDWDTPSFILGLGTLVRLGLIADGAVALSMRYRVENHDDDLSHRAALRFELEILGALFHAEPYYIFGEEPYVWLALGVGGTLWAQGGGPIEESPIAIW